MKNLALLLCFCSGFSFAQWGGNANYPDTQCSQGRYTIYVNGVAQATQYTQLHTVIPAAMLLSQKYQMNVVVKGSDINCWTTWRKIASSSAASSSTSSRLSSASSVIVCQPSTITTYYSLGNDIWVNSKNVTASIGATLTIGSQPHTGAWTYSGCGVNGTTREFKLTPTANCNVTVTHTNSCGGIASAEYLISTTGLTSSSVATGTTVTVVWTAPTERENGDVLLPAEIGGYEIRYTSNNKFVYVDVKNGTQAVISDYPQNGTMEIAAYDTHGLYSQFVKVVE